MWKVIFSCIPEEDLLHINTWALSNHYDKHKDNWKWTTWQDNWNILVTFTFENYLYRWKSPLYISKENIESLQTRVGYCLTGRPGLDLILFVNPTTSQETKFFKTEEFSFLKKKKKETSFVVSVVACSFDSLGPRRLINRGEHLRGQNIFLAFL